MSALDSFLTWCQRRRRLLVVVSLVLVVGISVAGQGHYAQLQEARTADAFRELVQDDGETAFRWAGGIDLAFAASYGFLAFLFAASGAERFKRIRWVGAALVVLAALLDEVENVLLQGNLGSHPSSLTDADVEIVPDVGQWKWMAGRWGAVLLLFALVAPRLFPTDVRARMRAWWSTALAWHVSTVLLALAFLIPTAFRIHTGLWFLVVIIPMGIALAVVGSLLNAQVTASRAEPPDGVDLGPGRLGVWMLQLLVGVLCVALGWWGPGYWFAIPFYAGLILSAMALAGIVSEARANRRGEGRRGPIMVGSAFVALVLATRVEPGALFFLLLAAGVLVGWLGTELGSEDYQRRATARTARRRPQPAWMLGLIGLGIAVAGTSLLIVGGADPAVTFALVLGLAVLVAMASSAGDGLVVIVAIAMALVWTTSPSADELDDERTPVADEPYFAVLGDSYVSGEGANVYLENTNEVVRNPGGGDYTNECRRAKTAWPFLLAERSGFEGTELLPAEFPTRVAFLACSGAVAENISTEPRVDIQGNRKGPAELDLLRQQKAEVGHDPEFIILSIGGNDAGFGDIGQTCIGPGSCAEVAQQFLTSRLPEDEDEHPEGVPEPLSKIGDDLDAVYHRIYEAFPGVPVIAAGYPRPMDEAARCKGALFDYEERVFVNGFLRELNTQVRAAAERNGATYLDMTDALTRKRAQLCGSTPGNRGLNFLAFNSKGGTIRDALAPTNWIHNSIHPTVHGHELLAEKAAMVLDGATWPPPAPPPSTTPPAAAPPDVAPVREVLAGLSVPQCVPAEREACDVNGRRWLLEQLKHTYSSSLLPLSLLMVGLWMCLAPLITFARLEELHLRAALAHAWTRVAGALAWIWTRPA